jgi:redox-sensitive bicupin YhaK (pirin superfamily)
MSGPVALADAPAVADCGHPADSCVEVTESHTATVGRFSVRRALPRRGRRTVGAWCFADHMGPAQVTETSGLDIGPHPHIGLQTVTWLLDGEALHRDSLGSEQLIAPGQLNLMTAGIGVSHSEEATGGDSPYSGPLEGIQLWIAQPDATRNGPPAFEHHGELPQIDLSGATATLLIGEVGTAASPARHDTPLAGIDLDFSGGDADVPLRPDWEYALIVLRGAVSVGQLSSQPITPGHLAYLGEHRDELSLHGAAGTRALLLGGEPFPERILMWWNFVGRTVDDFAAAREAWQQGDERFGTVASQLARIPAAARYWPTG